MKYTILITEKQVEALQNAYINYGLAYGDEKSEWDIDRLNDIVSSARSMIGIILPILKKHGVTVNDWKKEVKRQINEERKQQDW